MRTRGRNRGPLRGEPTSLEPQQVYAFRNVILDPVAIAPSLGVDLYAIQLHAEVEVIAFGS